MFLIPLLLLAVCSINAEQIVVRVKQGLLRGEVRQRSTGNGKYCSFKGIPYAAPPVDDLRFRAPEPPLSWKGERDATKHRSICPQTEIGTGKYIPGDEDCLFLNVYTPTIKPKNPLPVMIYIHAGLFISGSGNADQLAPDFLLDNDVIVVTFNFRLGILGFLSFDIEEASGNAGLKDQVAAMQWVKKNIANFGGDPDNVTIFGQATGGSSVTLHLLSPMSKGLFKRAIALSGTFLKDFAKPFEHKRRAFLLTQQLGLYTQDPEEALQFLKNASVKTLVTAKPFILFAEQPRTELLEFAFFRPIVEKEYGGQHFFVEDPEKLLRENKTNVADLILGYTTEEGIYRAITQKTAILKYYPLYKQFLVPSKIVNIQKTLEVLKLGDQIQKHYFGDQEISEGTMREIIKFYSYFSYVINIHRFLEMWTKTGNKAYFYEFSCFSERNFYGQNGIKYGLRKATHRDDIPYLFDGPKFGLRLDKKSPSYKMITQTCKLYTNYAKYGNPTPAGSKTIWKDYSQNNSYLDIGFNLTLKTDRNKAEVDFWRDIYESAELKFS